MTIAPKVAANITTNVPDDAIQVYNPASTYAKGNMVQFEDNIYSSLADNNTGITPGTDVTIWYHESNTNKMGMFDPYIDSKTVHNADIVVTLDSSDIDVIALFGVVAESVSIVVHDNTTDTDIYSETKSMVQYSITNWYEWTYVPGTQKKEELFLLREENFLLPMAYDVTITVTIKAFNGTASCSHLTWGRTLYLGCTQWGATVSRRSNISKERKPNGQVYLSQGISWKRMTVPVKADTWAVDEILNRLSDIDGIPTLFMGDESGKFKSLLVYGFFRDFDIPITVEKTAYNLEIEGIG